ncbi:hypothetical protein DM01DRAFT_315853 [Hesseltinella vesiculosa]|uniref:C2H2-type domain-containing protein n=1 Tax=Hesseltinella vesiculosa TaxID=101127 RepID=A0A1X2GF25_9FUNG|nr:hypothetical protein DM01DRAFT_315853 [Hesseltinella vesiculosa]
MFFVPGKTGVKSKNRVNSIAFACPSCDDGLTSLDELQIHLQIHVQTSNELINNANNDIQYVAGDNNDEATTIVDASPIPPAPVEGLIPRQCSQESFASDDHHPLRKYNYTFEDVVEWEYEHPWQINHPFDVMEHLKQFHLSSLDLNSKGNIQDMRILSLYSIFAFSEDIQKSVTRYMGQKVHEAVMADLDSIMQKMTMPPTNNVIMWSNELMLCRPVWLQVAQMCTDFLAKGRDSTNADDFIAATCMLQLATRLTKSYPDELCEDSFVHRHLDGLLDTIFAAEPRLKQEWANRWMATSTTLEKSFKPDFVVYVKPWHHRFDLATCEIKAPNNRAAGPINDYVKLCMEMKQMLFKMENAVDQPFVLGILVEGHSLTTYYMDKLGVNGCRVVRLSSTTLISELSNFGSFPMLFRAILQVRDLALIMAQKIEHAQLILAKEKRAFEIADTEATPSWKKFKGSPTLQS